MEGVFLHLLHVAPFNVLHLVPWKQGFTFINITHKEYDECANICLFRCGILVFSAGLGWQGASRILFRKTTLGGVVRVDDV